MKKILFSLFLLLFAVSAYAQNYYKKMPTGEFELNEKSVISKDQRPRAIEEWLSITFKPSDYTFQKNEEDGRYTVTWKSDGETFSKYANCEVSAVYIIDITPEGYSVKIRKPQSTLKIVGFPHQYVLPYRSTVKRELKSFIENYSAKYYRKSLTWDDDDNLRKIENELYEESIRLPRNLDGTPKPTKRYYIMVEKHNICETVSGSLQKANLLNLEALYNVMNNKR